MKMLLEKTKYDLSAFGKMPERPLHLSVKPLSVKECFLGGSATFKEMEMELEFESENAKIPLSLIIPKVCSPLPAVVIIGEQKDYDDTALQWVSKGYAVFYLCYLNISSNNGNFKSGISAYVSPTRRKKSSAGKIAVWAWAAIRALEYAEVLDYIDTSKIGIVGKGVLGLSALLAKEHSSGFTFASTIDLPKIDEEFVLSNPHLFSP